MARINVIEYEESENELTSTYDDLIQKRGKLSEVLKIQSLNPATIKSHAQLYLDIMFAQSPLTRAQREMIAVVVSVANGCKYCQVHHTAALNNYWKNEKRIEKLKKDFAKASLSEKELAMCEFAVHLTKDPAAHEATDFTQTLRDNGLSDRAILDIVLVIAYFNYVNRIVMALGVELEEDQGKEFNY